MTRIEKIMLLKIYNLQILLAPGPANFDPHPKKHNSCVEWTLLNLHPLFGVSEPKSSNFHQNYLCPAGATLFMWQEMWHLYRQDMFLVFTYRFDIGADDSIPTKLISTLPRAT